MIVSCQDLNENYNWRENPSANFYRKYGNIGYDYGWSVSNSPFDNGIIITGSKEKNVGGEKNLWAIKTDSRGLTSFERSYGGEKNDEGYDVISTSDGGFLFVGYTWSFGNEQQVYAIKIDFNGNLLWEKTFGGSMWEVGHSVIELKDGGYMIIGFSNSPGISSGNTDVLLLKIDEQGNKIWMKAYGNIDFPNHEWGYGILELNDNSLMVVGSRDRYNKGGKNILIYRFDKFGEIIWEKELGSVSNTNEEAYDITKNNLGDIFISVGKNSDEDYDKYMPEIIRIDSYGNIEWKRLFKTNSKSYHQFNISNTLSGDLILVGSSISKSSINHTADAFMMRLNRNGDIIWTNNYGSFEFDDWG